MNRRVLFVDDEANVLLGFERQLRRRFEVETALGGEAGLLMLETPPYAVVVSDMRMPGINGIEFLTRTKQVAPDAQRVMLTGVADQDTAVAAINEGSIFRFLAKPCPADALIRTLEAAVRQHELVISERELLEQTLSGAVRATIDILALASPAAFGRATRLRRLVREFAQHLPAEDAWQLDVAAMLSQLGCVTLPDATLGRALRGEALSPEETAMFAAHPAAGAELIANIPRLEAVGEIIAYQEKRFDGEGPPPNGKSGTDIPLGARLLKVALDFDALTLRGLDGEAARDEIFSRSGWYDPDVVKALACSFDAVRRYERQSLALSALKPGMLLGENMAADSGVLLMAQGQEVTAALLTRLRNFLTLGQLERKINVLTPAARGDGDHERA